MQFGMRADTVYMFCQVKFTADKRSVWVTTKDNAPGGVRTEKVGLPYDPDLFYHMVEHGVCIEVRHISNTKPSHG